MAQYHFDKRQLYEFLKENRGYLKWGASKIRGQFCQAQVSEDAIYKIRDLIRNDKPFDSLGEARPPNFSNDDHSHTNDTEEVNDKEYIEEEADQSVQEAYDEFLENRGLTRADVKSVKHWQTMSGEPRFSVTPYSNYQLNFSHLEDRFADKLGDISTPEIKQPESNGSNDQRKCDVIGLHDAHIDKVVLASETGYETDATIDENVNSFVQEALTLLQKSKEDGVDTVFFPVGSDFWTVNDDRNTTKRGTKQRVIVPFQKSFEVGVEAVIEVLRYAAENFQRVVVPVVYGNHDEDLDFFLGMVLEQAFATTDHVEINKDRIERKYYKFGNNGFMFAHGYHSKRKSDIQKLPSNFSEDTDKSARIWYETRGGIRKAFLADIHHEKGYQHERNKDGIGLSIQFMRSIGNQGKYEWDNGWTGVPKTAYLWRFFEEGNKEHVYKQVWW